MMTSFALTSLSAIFPSGETLDRVIPGMFRVVACGRTRGVWDPEFWRTGGLDRFLAVQTLQHRVEGGRMIL